MAEALVVSVYFLAAFLGAIGLVLSFAFVLHWGQHREEGLLPYIFYPVFLVVALGVLFSGRNLYLPFHLAVAGAANPSLLVWATRATSMFIVFAAGERIARRFLGFGGNPSAPTLLLIAFGFYFLTNVVSSALLGAHASFSHEYFYPVLAGCAALLFTPQEGDTAIRSARNALCFFLALSAACMAWRPEMVLIRDYQGLLPGLSLRYAGLSSNPNSLGPLAVVFLLCLRSRPYSARWLNRLGWILGCTSLIFTQSKTSWIAFVLCASCIAYFRHRGVLASRLFDFRRPLLPATLLLVAMLMTCVLVIAFLFGGGGETAGAFFETREGADLLSLTGRTLIWEAAIQEWRTDPLFGYGLTIWDEVHRMRLGLPAAYHAHNQFYQSLASAGIVGAVGLAIYAVMLFRFALKTTKASRGLSLAFFILIFIRSISEIPLDIAGYGPEQMIHLLMLMVIASHLARPSHAPETLSRHGLVAS